MSQSEEYIKLISQDDFEFIIKRDVAMLNGTINNMLTGAGKYRWIFPVDRSALFAEQQENQVKFEEIKYAPHSYTAPSYRIVVLFWRRFVSTSIINQNTMTQTH